MTGKRNYIECTESQHPFLKMREQLAGQGNPDWNRRNGDHRRNKGTAWGKGRAL